MDDNFTLEFLKKMVEIRSNSLSRSKDDLKVHPMVEEIYDSSYTIGYNDAIRDIMNGKYPELTNPNGREEQWRG